MMKRSVMVLGVLFLVAGSSESVRAGDGITVSPPIVSPPQASPPAKARLGVILAGGGKGPVVLQVEPGSPAEKAGIRAGDVINGVDSAAVSDASDVARIIGGKTPGDVVNIEVTRDGKSKTLTAKVSEPLALQLAPPAPQSPWTIVVPDGLDSLDSLDSLDFDKLLEPQKPGKKKSLLELAEELERLAGKLRQLDAARRRGSLP